MKFEVSKNLASSFMGAVGIISSIASLWWPDVKHISIWWVNLILTVSLWFIIFMLMHYTNIKRYNNELGQENKKLKARRFYEIPFNVYKYSDTITLLIHNNEIFTNATYVGIYHKIDNYEHLAFIGSIMNYQINKKIQVDIVFTMTKSNRLDINSNTIKNLIIRPSFPFNSEFVEYLKNG